MHKNKEIIILGMHRSGTSVLSGVISSILNFSNSIEDGNLISQDNILGYYENLEIVDLNNKILESHDSSWKDLSYLDKRKEFVIEEIEEKFSKEAIRIVQKSFLDGIHVVSFKDPRISLLINFWNEIFNNPYYIYIYRNPMDVASSLKRRGDLDYEEGFRLWEIYNKLILDFFKSYSEEKKLLVKYEDLLHKSERHSQRIAHFLEVDLSSTDLLRSVLQIVPQINHGKNCDKDIYTNSDISQSTIDLFKTMNKIYNKSRAVESYHYIELSKKERQVVKLFRNKVSNLDNLISQQGEHILLLNQRIDEYEQTLGELVKESEALTKENNKLRNILKEIQQSKSWQLITKIKNILRRG